MDNSSFALEVAKESSFLLRGFPTQGHLKVLYLYLDFPLRCISLGHSGAAQQKGERGSCSVALWLTEVNSGGLGWLTLHLRQGFPIWLREALTFCVFSVWDCSAFSGQIKYTNALMQHAYNCLLDGCLKWYPMCKNFICLCSL